MNKKDLAIVTKWEFNKIIRNKAFLISTFLIPVLILVVSIVPQIIANKKDLHLVVVDDSGVIYSELATSLQSSDIQLSRETDLTREQIFEKAETDNKKSYLYIPTDFLKNKKVIYYFKSSSEIEGRTVQGNLNQIVKNLELKSLGLSQEVIDHIEENVIIEQIDVEQIDEEDNKSEFMIGQIIFMVVGFLMIFSSMMSGGFLLQSIVKEKSDKIVELLLSSVSSHVLMIGKILSSLLVGFVQTLIFLVIGVSVMKFGFKFDILSYLNWRMIYFLIYGILGLILIYALYALLGVVMKEVQSGGQVQPLMIILPIVPMWFASIIIENPLGVLPRIMSFIPPFTPVTMMLRIAFTKIAFWEIALTISFLVVFDIFMIYFVAKIFKTGLLMYGKNVSLKEAWRWFRQAEV